MYVVHVDHSTEISRLLLVFKSQIQAVFSYYFSIIIYLTLLLNRKLQMQSYKYVSVFLFKAEEQFATIYFKLFYHFHF